MRTSEQVIQELPWRWRVHGTIAFIGALGLLFDGWNVVLAGYVLPLLREDMALSATELGTFGAVGLAGMAVGSLGWGTAADVIGRKKVFLLTVLIYGLASLGCALAPSFSLLLVLRFIEGTGLGGCLPVDYSLVSEFMPKKVRGRVVALLGIAFPTGATICGLVSTLLLPLNSWRLMLGLMVVPALLTVWIRRNVPESPMFLLRKGREAQARQVVNDLVRRAGVPVEEWRNPPAVSGDRVSIGTYLRRLGDLWAFNWKLTGLAWLAFASVFFLYYGALNWMPSILVREGLNQYAAFLNTTLMTGVGILGTVLSSWLVDRWGRKFSLLVGGVGSGIGIFFFALWLDLGQGAALWLGLYGFCVQLLIGTLYVYLPEIYPTLLRVTGFGWASAVSRVTASAAPLLLGSLLWPALGLVGAFAVTAVAVVVSLLLLLAIAPETKGRELAGTRKALADDGREAKSESAPETP